MCQILVSSADLDTTVAPAGDEDEDRHDDKNIVVQITRWTDAVQDLETFRSVDEKDNPQQQYLHGHDFLKCIRS